MDAANKSLADALHFSFRLLSLIMIVALGALLLTGMARIKPQEAGLKLLFGRIQGTGEDRVFGEGLKLSWPEPVGRVERVSIKSKELKIDDFWMDEKPDEINKRLEDRRPSMEGLRPGYDGVLLTGDRGLVHVKFTCLYKFKGDREDPGRAAPSAVIDYLSNIADPEDVVRSAVCNAAIHASATRTAEAIYSKDHEEYIKDILARTRSNWTTWTAASRSTASSETGRLSPSPPSAPSTPSPAPRWSTTRRLTTPEPRPTRSCATPPGSTGGS